MSTTAQVGEIKIKTYEEAEIEWEISNYSSAAKQILEGGIASPVFFFADAPCYFKLIIDESDFSELIDMEFSLECKSARVFDVEFTYGIRKLDGNVDDMGEGIWKEDSVLNISWITFDEIENRIHDFAPSNVLTIKSTLKREISQPAGTDQSKFKKLIKLRTLSDNFRSLSANKENCDKILIVQEKEHTAHEAVLAARSSVFAAMFMYDTLEKQTGIISIPDCDSDTFQQFLEFLYCGKLEEVSFCSALNLYETSEKYDVQGLKTFCVEYLVSNMTEENVREVVITADKYGDGRLFSAVQELINRDRIKNLDISA